MNTTTESQNPSVGAVDGVSTNDRKKGGEKKRTPMNPSETEYKNIHVTGLGRIFKKRFERNGETYESPNWSVAICYRGKQREFCSKSPNESDAHKFLIKKYQELTRGGLNAANEDKVTLEQMAEDFVRDYEINRKRSIHDARNSVSHLRSFFQLDKAVEITTDRVRAYISSRQREKNRRGRLPTNATINRELAALKRMFTLAKQAGKISSPPYIPTLEENNARQGFIEHGDFLTLQDGLPEHLRDPVTFLYRSGWRVSEMRTLEWRDVDLEGEVVRLRPEIAKNKDGRVLPLRWGLLQIFHRAFTRRRLGCPFVFHKGRRPIGDFKKAWRTGCNTAGLPTLKVHDFRRTAVRNLVRAGVPEKVAMAWTGHKTREVFDRYNIVNEKDLAQAADQLEAYLRRQPAKSKVHAIKMAVNAMDGDSDTIRTQGPSIRSDGSSGDSKSLERLEPPGGFEPPTY